MRSVGSEFQTLDELYVNVKKDFTAPGVDLYGFKQTVNVGGFYAASDCDTFVFLPAEVTNILKVSVRNRTEIFLIISKTFAQ